MEGFAYVRAQSVAHALSRLNEPQVRSRPLAGGTDLLLLARGERVSFDRIVDISLIPELHAIEWRDGAVTIGAAATFSEILADPIVARTAPLLAAACREIGAVQIRNMGTIGGNVANAAACADSLPALVCLDASAHVLTLSGTCDYLVADLVTGPNRTRIPEGGLLVSLSYAAPPPESRGAFLKLGRRNAMSISRLTVAALGRVDGEGCIDEVRLVVGSAMPQIQRLKAIETALLCRRPGADLWRMAGSQAAEEMVRQAGHRWSTAYKEIALASLVARALALVFEPGEHAGDTTRMQDTTGSPVSRAETNLWPDSVPAGPQRRNRVSPRNPVSPQSLVSTEEGSLAAPPISFTLNGSPVSVEARADRSLLDLLRVDLGLTGTKEGCGIGECGACSVLLDGRLVNSCLVLAGQVAGRSVVTIEGIRGPDGGANDLQQAFIEHGAVQCGYCIPGMVLAGEALLASNPAPARREIREAIAGNLCRCTGYQQIVDAIEATAERRNGGR